MIFEFILVVFWLAIGFATGVGIVFIFQQDRVFDATKRLQKYVGSINRCIEEINQHRRKRDELQAEVARIKSEIRELQRSVLQMGNECEVLELAWNRDEGSLKSTSRVNVDEAMVFGRGKEWVYLYTFPAHEQLAHARQQPHYPMKLGMSTQDDVVTRVHQQVSGNSTAISERAVIRLVFRVNDSRDMESWMHSYFKRINRPVSDSVGTEWFNTNPAEVERLFRSYVLQRTRQNRPVVTAEAV